MSAVEVIVGACCDYPGCRTQTPEISDNFYARPTAPGWETWVGKRRRMDYCPEHAVLPKSPTMRRVWPS